MATKSGLTGDTTLPLVFVDGDSCPTPVRDVLIRWSDRNRIVLSILANRPLPVNSDILRVVAAERTVDDVVLGLLAGLTEEERNRTVVVTRDIPLAERSLAFEVFVVNDRGDEFRSESIAERRSIRDRNAEIRALGLESMNSRRTFDKRDVKAFSDTLDRILVQIRRRTSEGNRTKLQE